MDGIDFCLQLIRQWMARHQSPIGSDKCYAGKRERGSLATHRGKQGFDARRRERIIGVEDGYVVAVGDGQPTIERRRRPAVGLPDQDHRTRRPICKLGQELEGPIGRTVIDDDQFNRRVGLREYGTDRFAQEGRMVVRRNYNGNERSLRRRGACRGKLPDLEGGVARVFR